MERASIHTNSREGKERQEMRVFPHQPEELTGISVFLSFPTGISVQTSPYLGGPSKTSLYTEYRNWCLSRSGRDPPLRSSCNLSFTWVKLKNGPISEEILTYFTQSLRRGEEGV